MCAFVTLNKKITYLLIQVNKYTFDIMQKFYLNKFYYNYYYNFCSTAISAGDLGLASSPPVFLHMCIIGTSGNL